MIDSELLEHLEEGERLLRETMDKVSNAEGKMYWLYKSIIDDNIEEADKDRIMYMNYIHHPVTYDSVIIIDVADVQGIKGNNNRYYLDTWKLRLQCKIRENSKMKLDFVLKNCEYKEEE